MASQAKVTAEWSWSLDFVGKVDFDIGTFQAVCSDCSRLISWAGKRIDPVGVDYILQKLGFQHARLTIPKWMQRGAMDPLDKVLSMLTHRIIQVLKEPDKEPEEASK